MCRIHRSTSHCTYTGCLETGWQWCGVTDVNWCDVFRSIRRIISSWPVLQIPLRPTVYSEVTAEFHRDSWPFTWLDRSALACVYDINLCSAAPGVKVLSTAGGVVISQSAQVYQAHMVSQNATQVRSSFFLFSFCFSWTLHPSECIICVMRRRLKAKPYSSQALPQFHLYQPLEPRRWVQWTVRITPRVRIQPSQSEGSVSEIIF